MGRLVGRSVATAENTQDLSNPSPGGSRKTLEVKEAVPSYYSEMGTNAASAEGRNISLTVHSHAVGRRAGGIN